MRVARRNYANGRGRSLGESTSCDYAKTDPFKFADRGSRFKTWTTLDDLDPEEKTSTRSAEAYARKSIVACDESTGIRYVRAGWFQEFVRRTGTTANPSDVADLMVAVGWRRPGSKGQIKATDPAKLRKPIVTAFYVVPTGWEDAQEAAE